MISEEEHKFGIKQQGIPDVYYVPLENGADAIYLRNQDSSIDRILVNIKLCDDTKNLDYLIGSMHHELGHKYSFWLAKSIGNQKIFTRSPVFEEDLGFALVREGIGHYFFFELTKNGKYKNMSGFKDSDWPKDLEDWRSLAEPKRENFRKHLCYFGGYRLVKPIIDGYGRDGIEYLISNPPTSKDLIDLPFYRSKALTCLHKTHRK
ncbi:MAG: hypothetical protein AABW41_04405 [Nanoarchaeota archaeon]